MTGATRDVTNDSWSVKVSQNFSMLATLLAVVLSTITTPCLGLVSHGLYSLTPAPYLHKQAVSSLQSRYLTRGYSVFRDSQVTKLIICHHYGWQLAVAERDNKQ